jgi:head-tail adaptor
MTSTLTTAEIAQMRADVEDLVLPDTGDILSVTQVSDGQGGFTDTWGTATADVKCRLDYMTGMEAVFGGALKPYSGWNLTVPYNTTLTAAHRFYLSGNTYAVVEVDTDKSWNLFIRAKVEKV